jgi:hypothetical protein
MEEANPEAAGAMGSCPGPPGRLSALSVFLCKSVLYGAFVWARRAHKHQKRRFPARVVNALCSLTQAAGKPGGGH